MPSSFEEKYNNPAPVSPVTLAEKWEKLKNEIGPVQALNTVREQLDAYEDAVMLQTRLMNIEDELIAKKERQIKLEKEFDKLLTGKGKKFEEELKKSKLLTDQAKKLKDITESRGIEYAKGYTQSYETVKQEYILRKQSGNIPQVRGGADPGRAALGGMLGSMMGGHGGAGIGTLLGSYARGGIKPSEAMMQRFPNMSPGAARLLSIGGAGLAAVAAAPIAISAIQRGIGTIENQVMRVQQYRLAGQQAGGGVGEGVHQAFRTRMLSLNPFDAITPAIAKEIVQGTIGTGFKGSFADSMEQAVKSTYIKTGMNIPDIIQLFTLGLRNMGLSLQETEKEIKSFHTSVKDTNLSLQEYTQRVTGTAGYLSQQGTGTHSIQLAKALTATFQKPWEQGQVEQMLQNPMLQGQLAGVTGVMPSLQLSEAVLPSSDLLKGLQVVVDRQRELGERAMRSYLGLGPGPLSKRDQDRLNNATASYLNQMPGGPFQGVGVPQIENLFRRSDVGRGPGGQGVMMQATEDYRNRFQSVMKGIPSVTKQQLQQYKKKHPDRGLPMGVTVPMSNAQALRGLLEERTGRKIPLSDMELLHNLTHVGDTTYLTGRTFANLSKEDRERARSGRMMKGDTLSERLYNARLRTYRDLQKQHIFGPQQARHVREHLLDRDFNITSYIRDTVAPSKPGLSHRGQAVGVNTGHGTVIIKLDPATNKLYLQTDGDKFRANNSGQGSHFDSPTSTPPRTSGQNQRQYGGNYGG